MIKNRLNNYLIPFQNGHLLHVNFKLYTKCPLGRPPQDDVHICCFAIFSSTYQKLLNLEWFSLLQNDL